MAASTSSTQASTVDRHERHSRRSFDIIVHGATGFTGRRVIRHLASKHPSLNIAICGRSEDRLLTVANEVGWDETKIQSSVFVVSDANSIGGSVGDVPSELSSVFSTAKVVIACAGPYRKCGLPVLGAAIEAQCDYLDLCGEPQFFDDALFAFDRKARDAGVLAVHAAAFDCVPAELGAALAERELLKKQSFNNNDDDDEIRIRCAGIEIIHTMSNVSTANATTFHAAVDGFHAASNGELAASRKRVKENYPEFEETKPPPRPKDWPNVPEFSGSIVPGYDDELGLRTMKFVGADASAIRSSWRYLRSRSPDHVRRGKHVPEPRLSVLMGMDANDSLTSLKVMAYGAAFSTLARWQWGCDLLHSNPEVFSGGVFSSKGPSEQELESGGFTTYVTAFGSKYGASSDAESEKNQIARVVVRGPEPGYVATPRLIGALCLTILEAGKGKDNGVGLSFDSGVTLPGALFGDSDKAFEFIRDEGLSFDVEDDFHTFSN